MIHTDVNDVMRGAWIRGVTTEVYLDQQPSTTRAKQLATDEIPNPVTTSSLWPTIDWTFLYGRQPIHRINMAVLVLGPSDWVLSAALQLLSKVVFGMMDTLLLAPVEGVVSSIDLCPNIPMAVRVALLEVPRVEGRTKICEGLVREAQLQEGGKYVLRSVGCWRRGRLLLRSSLFPVLTSFKGAVLKVLGVKGFNEIIIIPKGDSIELKGMLGEMLDKFIKKLNFKMDFNEIGGHINKMANGTFGGVLGAIQRREYDILLGSLSMIPVRTEVIDYSEWWWMYNTPFFTKVPKIKEDQFLLFQIYTWQTWCTIAGFLVLSSAAQALTWREKVSGVRHHRETSVSVHVAASTIFKTAVYMSSVRQPVNIAGRLVLISTWLVVIVLVAAYSGNLIAFLSIPRIEKVPQTVHELREMGYILSISYGYSQYEKIKASPISDHQYLFRRSVFRQDKGLLPDPDHVQMILTQPVAMIVTGTTTLALQDSFAEKVGSVSICSMKRSTDSIFEEPTGIAFPKNSPIKPIFDNLLVWMRSSQLVDFGSIDCVLPNLRSDTAEPLNMVKMGGVMVLWAVGVTLGCLLFLAEKISSTLN
ncbi:ionotropic receptor 25a-like [Homarus americanus]|uniref:ionotropic receptor 25a-like n=1 Tax=Homarus americanus TaxID=6706 RepID=UPI001C4965A0|nr:ionotropic receptor 25a-like [Homarus americanus]